MARLPRLSAPGLLHYLILRARPGIKPFAHPEDCDAAIELLGRHARRLEIEWHAYVLLPDCAQFLATPPQGDSLSQWVQAFGRQFVPRFNRRSGTRGSPWDGRFRATVVDADTYLLDAMFSLDQKPVQQGYAPSAAQYPWSSHAHYVGRRPMPWLTPPAQYWALGNTPFAREASYADRFAAGVPLERQRQLEGAALRGWALGNDNFLAQLDAQVERRTRPARVGRPRHSKPRLGSAGQA